MPYLIKLSDQHFINEIFVLQVNAAKDLAVIGLVALPFASDPQKSLILNIDVIERPLFVSVVIIADVISVVVYR